MRIHVVKPRRTATSNCRKVSDPRETAVPSCDVLHGRVSVATRFVGGLSRGVEGSSDVKLPMQDARKMSNALRIAKSDILRSSNPVARTKNLSLGISATAPRHASSGDSHVSPQKHHLQSLPQSNAHVQ